MSVRHAAIAALVAALDAALAVEVTRDETRSVNPPDAGLVIVREGATREAVPIMSPLRYQVTHDVEVIVLVPHAGTVPQASATRDALLVAIAAAVAADRTLGGAVEWAGPQDGPEFEEREEDGAGAMLAARQLVSLHFTAPDSPAG